MLLINRDLVLVKEDPSEISIIAINSNAKNYSVIYKDELIDDMEVVGYYNNVWTYCNPGYRHLGFALLTNVDITSASNDRVCLVGVNSKWDENTISINQSSPALDFVAKVIRSLYLGETSFPFRLMEEYINTEVTEDNLINLYRGFYDYAVDLYGGYLYKLSPDSPPDEGLPYRERMIHDERWDICQELHKDVRNWITRINNQL